MINLKMKVLLILTILLVSACSSSGVVSVGEDTFLITEKAAGCGFSSAEGTKVDVYIKANAHCASLNKDLVTVNITARDGVPLVRCASAELEFKCVDKN